MASSNYKAKYSCRRKKDFMTFSAVSMFILLIAFQLYLIFIVPIQLKKADALELAVAKDEMLTYTDYARANVQMTQVQGDYCQGEHDMVLGVLDNLAIFIRTNRDKFTLGQSEQLKHVMLLYNSQCDGWKNGRFYLREEVFSSDPYVEKISEKTKEHYR